MKKRWIFVPVLIVFCIGIILGIEIKEPQKVRSVKTFTAFFGVTGDELEPDNEIKK